MALVFDRANDRFKIVKREDVYQNIQILNLGDVSELSVKPYDKGYYKELITGYPKQTFEKFQGVNDVNLSSSHYIDMPVKSKKNIQSPYKTSSIAIELLRRSPFSFDASKDTKDDNSLFVIELDSSRITVQGASDLSGFLGISQYYNWTITPRENIIRHGQFIQQGLFKHPTQDIDKVSYQKETNAYYLNQNGDIVGEFDNIKTTELSTLKVYPEIYVFKSSWNITIITQLNSNPHGYITFVYKGVTFKGFVLEVSGNPYTKKASYTLLKANL